MKKEEEPNIEPNIEKEAEPAEKAEEAKHAKKAEKAEKAEKLKAELLEERAKAEEAKKELDALNDKYLRLAAEYDNYRKRTQKEREGLYSDAKKDAIAAFLPVIDGIERASAFATDESELAKGVLLLQKQLFTTLEKMEIREIDSTGEQFDPELHNAIIHEEDEEKPENTVAETLQKGYMIGDKVIRHALVKVVN